MHKITTLALLFLGIMLNAQEDIDPEIQNLFWANPDPAASATTFPERWENESVVILYSREFHKYTNRGKKAIQQVGFHNRYKILDKAAVAEFSEYSFNKDEKSKFLFVALERSELQVGIKVIKPSGKEVIIDVNKDKVLQDDTFKIAIPNLEVGDILDIYRFADRFERTYGDKVFERVERTLRKRFPVVTSVLSLEVENDFFIRMASFNGAPEIKEEPTDSRSTKKYIMRAENLEKMEPIRWFYPLIEMPSVKFQVVFALNKRAERNATVFLPEEDKELFSFVKEEEVLDYYKDAFEDNINIVHYRRLRKLSDAMEGATQREKVTASFYYFRHKYFTQFLEPYIAREADIDSYANVCDAEYYRIADMTFLITVFKDYLKDQDIPYEILLAKPRWDGKINKLLFRENLAIGLKIFVDDGKPMYIMGIGPHAQPGFIDPKIEGTEALKLSLKNMRKIKEIEHDTIPESTAGDNILSEHVDVQISGTWDSISLKRKTEFKGAFKAENLNDRLSMADFLVEDYARYDTQHFYFCKRNQSRSDEREEEELKAAFAKLKDVQKEENLKRAKGEFDIDLNNYGYSVKQTGRYELEKPLIIEDSLKMGGDFIKRAGPNYIVEVGRFIGGQVNLEKDEMERGYPIYVDYAKTYDYEVSIAIPDGYEVVGLDKLNKKTSNVTGSFKSEAKIEEGKLVYTTSKIYSANKSPASQWPQMAKWLDTAHDFYSEKIMFRKK